MENIIDMIKNLDEETRQDLITFIVLNYPKESNKAGKYHFWPQYLKEEASDRLKKAYREKGLVPTWIPYLG